MICNNCLKINLVNDDNDYPAQFPETFSKSTDHEVTLRKIKAVRRQYGARISRFCDDLDRALEYTIVALD